MSGSQVDLQSFGQAYPASIEHAIAKNGSEDEGPTVTSPHRKPSIIAGKIAQVSVPFAALAKKRRGLLASSAGGAASCNRVRGLAALGISRHLNRYCEYLRHE